MKNETLMEKVVYYISYFHQILLAYKSRYGTRKLTVLQFVNWQEKFKIIQIQFVWNFS